MLDKIAEHLISEALGGNPAAVSEARRQIEAGGTRPLESIAEAVEQQEQEPKG
jgi:hypothetical protein